MLNREAETKALANSIGLPREIAYEGLRWEDGEKRTLPEAEQHLDHFCVTEAHRRSNGTDRIAAGFRAYLQTLNLTYPWREILGPRPSEEDEADYKAEARAARAAVKAKHRQELLAAADMDIEEARDLKEPADAAERLSVEKAFIRDFYGEITEEVLLYDDDGKGRDKTRALARMLLYLEENGARLLKNDWAAHAHGVSATGLRHDCLDAFGRAEVLRQFGVTAPGVLLDRSKAKTAADWAHADRKELAVYGIHVRCNVMQRPYSLLSDVLRTVGLRLGNKQARENGTPVRTYWLDPETHAQALKFAVVERQRLVTEPERWFEGLTLEGIAEGFGVSRHSPCSSKEESVVTAGPGA